MPDLTDAAIEAEFPDVVAALHDAAAELRAAVGPADPDRIWSLVLAAAAATPLRRSEPCRDRL